MLSGGSVERIVLAVTVGDHGLLNEDMHSQLKWGECWVIHTYFIWAGAKLKYVTLDKKL